MSLLILFGILFPSALLLEGAMLPLFRIPLQRKNLLTVIYVNLPAQAVIVLTAGRALLNDGPMGGFFILFIAGFILMVAKALVYEHFLTAPNSKRSLSYGFFASLAVWAAFSFALSPLHTLLQRFG